jgi:hypothetical protein
MRDAIFDEGCVFFHSGAASRSQFQERCAMMRRVTMHKFVCLLALFVGAAATTPQVHAAVLYTVTDLGDLPGGSDYSIAYGINDSGQVVG